MLREPAAPRVVAEVRRQVAVVAGGLREAVAVRDRHAEALLEGGRRLHQQGAGAADDRLQGRDVGVGLPRLEQELEQCRHHRRHRHALVCHARPERARVEARIQDRCAPRVERGQVCDHDPVDVMDGQHAHRAQAAVPAVPGRHRVRVGHQVALVDAHALGRPGRARGVDEQRLAARGAEVLVGELDRLGVVRQGRKVLRLAALVVDQYQARVARIAQRLCLLGVVGAREEHARGRVVEDEALALLRLGRVHGGHAGAQRPGRQVQDDRVVEVADQEGDAIPVLHTERLQAGGAAGHHVGRLCVAPTPLEPAVVVTEDQEVGVGTARSPFVEQLRQVRHRRQIRRASRQRAGPVDLLADPHLANGYRGN